MNKEITYVIPVYGKPGLLTACLSSLRKYEPEAKVIVVDDAGPDGEELQLVAMGYNTLDFYVSYHRNEKNLGFAGTCNAGIEKATTEIVCLVNSDLEFTEPIAEHIEYSFSGTNQGAHVGIVGGLLLYPDGKIEHGGGFYHYFGVRHYGEKRYPYEARLCTIPAFRFFVTGALMAIKKIAWEALCGFNEDYKNDSEDADFCVRAWALGFKVFYNPALTAIHHKSQTLNDLPDLMPARIESNNKFRKFLATQDIEAIEKKINGLNGKLHPDLPRAFVRTNAMGDVLRALDLYREIDEAMVVVTNFPEVFRHDKTVAITPYRDEYEVGEIIDLDLTYERRPDLSIEASYRKFYDGIQYLPGQAPDLDYKKWQNRLVDFTTTGYDWAQVRMMVRNDWTKPFVVLHGRTGNPNRSMRPEFWMDIAQRFVKAGYTAVVVGSRTDTQLSGPGIVNLVDRLDMGMTRALLENAACFVGSDSGPMHLADGACPAVGIFTIATPESRVSPAVTPFLTPAPCRGCLHRQTPPLTNFTCEFPENDPQRFMCTEVINPQYVFDKAMEVAL